VWPLVAGVLAGLELRGAARMRLGGNGWLAGIGSSRDGWNECTPGGAGRPGWWPFVVGIARWPGTSGGVEDAA